MDYKNIKRYAFISYNHKDAKWAKWLQQKLESYKLPTEIHNEFEDSRFLRPVFRDKTDLNTGVLANELRKELEESRFLIVICSPNSAKSAWVSDEVKAFIEMGRLEYIIPFIVAGTPHTYTDRDCETCYEDECFPLFLRQYTREHPESELLGISTCEVGKEKAFIRVVSRMLGVSFDVLWKRHERQKRTKRIVNLASILIFISALISVWLYNQPFDSEISYVDQTQNPNLPFVDGRIEIILENDTLTEALTDIMRPTTFFNIPHKYHNKEIKLRFNGFGYQDLDTIIVLESNVSLPILRKESTYGLIQGIILDTDDSPVGNVQVNIMNIKTTTASNGSFAIMVPISMQKPSDEGYDLIVEKNGIRIKEKVYPEGDNSIINNIYL